MEQPPKLKKLPVDVHDFEKMKKLSISIQDFEDLVAKDCIYVDKTRHLYKMVTEGKFYFLSRPRRFGKSLLVSTLQHLFEGRKDLFKGLWIENADWDWKPHPVMMIDFSEITNETPEKLKEGLWLNFEKFAQEHRIRLSSKLLPESFAEAVIGLHRQHGERVAVLIDEYDKPLITHLGKGKEALALAKQNRDVLREFYGVLKGGNVNRALQFVFLTGISKFSQVSIFSELNNLKDLTMHPAYTEILGYTQEELEHYFADYIRKLASDLNESETAVLDKLKAWYDGYRFSETATQLYNPFSVLQLFDVGRFQNYWFETATPSFLVNLIKERKYPILNIESLEIHQTSFSAYDLDHLQLEPLLLQTGYITIQGYDGLLYRLGYPNQEVKNSFLGHLYQSLAEIENTALKEQYRRLHQYLECEQLDLFIETANAILAAIPYPHIAKKATRAANEHYYHTVFYLMLAASGVLVPTEVLTSNGRIDMEVYFPKLIYIVVLKCNQSAGKAIAQIKEKKYFEKHLQAGRKIVLLGINFSTRARRITDWRMEVMDS